MIMTETTIDSFNSQSVRSSTMLAAANVLKREHERNIKVEMEDSDLDEPAHDDYHAKNLNSEGLIETDDELLEVGSNERPDDESDDEDDEDDLDMSNGGRPLDFTTSAGRRRISGESSEGEDCFRPTLKRLAENDIETMDSTVKTKKGVKSFCIDDILSHKTAALGRGQRGDQMPAGGTEIVRPWDRRAEAAVGQGRGKGSKDSPLDALFNMASNFEALKAKSDMERAQLSFASKQPPKKKRKSRTAFTNTQIFELEKRFLYQKYLSPADRDEIAASLGLSNAQVICWFQNRRAKFKRDMEELKKDVEKSPVPGHLPHPSVDHRDPRLSGGSHHPDPRSIGHPRGPPLQLPVSAAAAHAAMAAAHLHGAGGPPGLPHPLHLLSMAPHLLHHPPHRPPSPPSPHIRVTEDSD